MIRMRIRDAFANDAVRLVQWLCLVVEDDPVVATRRHRYGCVLVVGDHPLPGVELRLLGGAVVAAACVQVPQHNLGTFKRVCRHCTFKVRQLGLDLAGLQMDVVEGDLLLCSAQLEHRTQGRPLPSVLCVGVEVQYPLEGDFAVAVHNTVLLL